LLGLAEDESWSAVGSTLNLSLLADVELVGVGWVSQVVVWKIGTISSSSWFGFRLGFGLRFWLRFGLGFRLGFFWLGFRLGFFGLGFRLGFFGLRFWLGIDVSWWSSSSSHALWDVFREVAFVAVEVQT
jgi:hypothetical protein